MVKLAIAAAAVATVGASQWEDYKQQFGKEYNSVDEDARRKAIFEANLDFIKEENQKGNSYTVGINQFADMTNAEYKSMLGYKPSPLRSLPKLGVHEYEGEELAGSVDWTTKGAVTPVKNQGQCGSCWAFSTTGGMEGAWEIASGKLVSLSEQQLVDCSKQNNGCNGGSMESAFSFEETVNVCTESSYPYKAADGTCKESSCSTGIPQGGITGYKSVGQSANAMKSALNQGPVSVAIEADQQAFQLYSGGILSSGCGSNLDHGVLAVGYGDGYWLVKNSWGSTWGDNGYVKISSTAGGSAGECGILSDASYPTVSASVTV